MCALAQTKEEYAVGTMTAAQDYTATQMMGSVALLVVSGIQLVFVIVMNLVMTPFALIDHQTIQEEDRAFGGEILIILIV